MDEKEYTGWMRWKPTNEELAEFLVSGTCPLQLKENEYLIIDDGEGSEMNLIYRMKDGKLGKANRAAIKINDPKDGRVKKVYTPRNPEQVCAFDLMKDPDTTIKLLTGTWGAGKDLIMASSALEQLKAETYEKIIWIRNPINLRDTPDLGALPGEVIDKLLPYLGPFIDNVGEAKVRTLLAKGALSVEPLQSLRGRNFTNSIIICSEAENLSFDQLKLIVARVAEGSCLYINGDVRQRDKVVFEKSKGLEKFVKCLAGEELFGYVHLPKSERSATASLADKLDRFDK